MITLNRFLTPSTKFTYRGRRYCVRTAGRSLVLLLKHIESASRRGESLLTARRRIHQTRKSLPPMLACFLLSRSIDATSLRLLIGLLGQNREHSATQEIVAHHEHSDPKVRLAVVRALHRLNAWRELSAIEQSGASKEIRRAASMRSKPSFQTRMVAFKQIVKPVNVSATQSEALFVDQSATMAAGKPPRTGDAIRAVLWRIRRILWRSRTRGLSHDALPS